MATAPLTAQTGKLPRPPIPHHEWRHLANWLLAWVVLANLGYMLMWIIGAPPRHSEILMIGVIGLIVRTQVRWVQYLAFIAVSLYSLLGFIAALFNLAISSLLSSVGFFMELDPSQSIEYVVAGSAVVLLCGLAWKGLRRPARFAGTRVVLVAGAVVISLAPFGKGHAVVLKRTRQGLVEQHQAPAGPRA